MLTDQSKKYLLVLNDKNEVKRLDVNPGRLLDDGSRVILPSASGTQLKPEDWMIVQGLQMARLNYPVEPIKPAGSASQPTTNVSDASK